MKKPFVLEPNGPPRPADKYDAPRLMADKAPLGFHLMIKPAGSACNLNCTYCFYLSKATLAGGPGARQMSDATLERLIRGYIEDVTTDEVVFTWQGGEPTLRGLDFFRKVLALQQKYAKPGQTVLNDLQTNGTLITVFGNFITKGPYCETYKAVFNHMEAVSSAIAMRRSRKKG